VEDEKERGDRRTNDLDFTDVGSQDIAFRDAIFRNEVGLLSCAALVHGGELIPHDLATIRCSLLAPFPMASCRPGYLKKPSVRGQGR
jgi:hypothetical protein